jgi:hypothetical protein
MGRKNTKQARYDAMPQRDQRRYDKRKQFGGKRRDTIDWTTRMFAKLEEMKSDDE